jgi:hypothetical protein
LQALRVLVLLLQQQPSASSLQGVGSVGCFDWHPHI